MEEEAAPETESVQLIESAPEPTATSDPQDCVMEEAVTQMVISEASTSHPRPIMQRSMSIWTSKISCFS